MRVAIIGAGHIAGIHAPEITACGNQIVGVADEDKIRAEAFARRNGISRAFTSAEEMISETKPDVVHVVTPPAKHAEPTLIALKQGCHVYVEKPMSVTTDEARKMIQAAKEAGVKLCVNHNMVYEPAIQKAVQMALSGKLGKIVSADIRLVFDPRRMPAYLEEGSEFSHWIYKLNGGPLEDLIAHPLSIILELMGEVREVKSVSHRRGILPGDWNDEVRVLVRSDEIMGEVSVSLNESPDVMIVTISGTKARVMADPFTGIVTVQRSSSLPRAARRGLLGFQLAGQYCKGAVANVFRFVTGRIDKSNGIGPLVRKFYQSLEAGDKAPVTADKGLKCVEIIQGIWPSRQGSEPRPSVRAEMSDSGPINLVTGGSGFVGSHIVEKLISRGKRVRVLTRKNSLHAGRLRAMNVEIVEGDLADRDSVIRASEGADVIYHAGAAMSADWDEQERVTIGGTRNVVEAAAKNNVRRLVHVSSLVVYELLDKDPGSIIKEDSPYQKDPRKLGPYAWSKTEAEKTVLEAVRNDGLDAIVFRPGIVVGERGRVFYPHLGYRLGADLFIPVGTGRTILPFVYVENLAEGMIKAAESENTAGKIYNMIDDGEVSVNEYLETYIKVTGSSARIVHMPYAVAWFLTLVYEAVSGLGIIPKGATSRAQLRWKQAEMHYDASAAKRDFDWKAAVPLREGMEKTFRWYAGRFGA